MDFRKIFMEFSGIPAESQLLLDQLYNSTLNTPPTHPGERKEGKRSNLSIGPAIGHNSASANCLQVSLSI